MKRKDFNGKHAQRCSRIGQLKDVTRLDLTNDIELHMTRSREKKEGYKRDQLAKRRRGRRTCDHGITVDHLLRRLPEQAPLRIRVLQNGLDPGHQQLALPHGTR